MAVMDFREGGVGFTLSRQRARRDHSFEERGWDDPTRYGETAAPRAAVDAPGLGTRIARLTHYLGALVSVGLMVGLAVWGWQLVMRDVSGVPVIKALVGEARTAPEEPGGELTEYTGYAVNSVAAGTEAKPAAELAIAPGATGLDDSDVPMGALGVTAREPQQPADVAISFDDGLPPAVTDAERRAAEAAEQAQAEAARAEMRAALAYSGAAVSDLPAQEGSVSAAVLDENGEPAQAEAITDAIAQASVVTATRPAPRPRRVAQVAAAAPVPAPVAAVAEAAPAPAPKAEPKAEAPAPAPAPAQAAAKPASGAPLVQIGAFDSDAIAQSEWGRVAGKHGALFSGKGQVIQKHSANGRTFYRARVAGFESRAEAQAFCAKLKAAGTDCIPATAN